MIQGSQLRDSNVAIPMEFVRYLLRSKNEVSAHKKCPSRRRKPGVGIKTLVRYAIRNHITRS